MAQSQNDPVSIAEIGYVPATVTEHKRHGSGFILITKDADPDTDIFTFEGERPAARRGTLREDEDG